MSISKNDRKRTRNARSRVSPIEVLESRQLLSTASAKIDRILGSLESQLVRGPLAEFNSGKVDSNGFTALVQAVEMNFEESLSPKQIPKVPQARQFINLQGERVVAAVVALNQANSVGLLSNAALSQQSGAAIDSLTGGPIRYSGTPIRSYVPTTRQFESDLNQLAKTLSAGTPTTITQVAMTAQAGAEAYRADVHAGLALSRPPLSSRVDSAINVLQSTLFALPTANNSTAQTMLVNAVSTFDSAVLGPQGSISRAAAHGGSVTPTNSAAAPPSAFSSVMASAAVGGPVTLLATLVNATNGSPIAGQTVSFSIGGAFAGLAVTNASGVAMTGIGSVNFGLGVDQDAVVASFAGSRSNQSSQASGNLVIGTIPTFISNVSGSAAVGGTGTVSANLRVSGTSTPVAAATIVFMLDGKAIGSAVTNEGGIATLSGITTSKSIGNDIGGITATFPGNTNFTATSAVGNFAVTTATTTLSAVSGTASFGGTATLTATLKSPTTNLAVPNATVSFTLDGTLVGTAITNSSGVAILSGITTTKPVGTDTGGIVASFTGNASFGPATSVAGNLVVSQAATTLSNVAGTAVFGSTATLTATLTSNVTNAGVSGETVSFKLDGTTVGTAVTNASGIATLTGVATTDPIGVHAGAVVASFAGDTNYVAAPAVSGALTVTQASNLSAVSGTASFGGTATLTATLKATSTSDGIAGKTVNFTLNGTSAGSAVTDNNGVATLTGVATTAAAGTDTGGVAASFAGDSTFGPSGSVTGDLVVAQAATSLGTVGGTASFGGTATLVATLTSAVTNQGASGQTVTFTLNGTSVGTAVTNASGVATLTGVTTTAPVGTDPGVVGASFTGSTNYVAAANATGDLVVSQSATTLSAVSGSAVFGQTATLVATLTSSATGHGVAGLTVSFTLDSNAVGTAVTDANGVATLTGVPNTQPVGTDAGAVVASFAGTADYTAAANATGNLFVSQPTSLGAASGTATFGGTATLTATLTSSPSGTPVIGQTISFTLNGTAAGTAVTDANGVATLPGVTTTASAGTDTGGVVATFVGTASFGPASATGDLVVSKANTVLSAVSGTAVSGSTATLVATLKSSTTNLGAAGETVDFTLDGVSVGNAVTDSNGIATLTGVTTSDPVGVHTGVVVASFAGDSNYNAAANASGNLTVTQPSAISAVSGSAAFGGTATLIATLTSSGSTPISGQTVAFSLGGTPMGTAVTNASGVATLSNVPNTAGVGTDTGAVVATFAGNGSFGPSNATGDLVVSKANTSLGTVSGTASFGGKATLVATLTSAATNAGVAGETVSFTLDNTPVGTAVTDSNGVATLANVTTSQPIGTDTGGVVASFAGDSNFNAAANGTGNLVVSKANTAFTGVSGSATVGGTATLTATLTSAVTNLPLANETVTFTLSGTTAGNAVTNANGVATITDVPTSAQGGTTAGAVVVSFAGDSNYNAAPNGTGDLVVAKANTALSAVSGTAQFGGTATLVATLTSTVTNQPIAGETVSFMLDNASVGTAVTNSSGIATLPGVVTDDPLGPDTGGITASFAGDSNYNAAPNATGTLVVSQGTSALNTVSGAASFGGTATLTATLVSGTSSQPIAGETVNFTLNGTDVGSAVTNSSGVASLPGVATNTPVGTDVGGVVASYAGNTNFAPATNASGNLVVSQAQPAFQAISGASSFGGSAVLTATLISSVTNQPLAGETVTFILDNKAVGSATTNASGVATLSDVVTTDNAGTDTDGIQVTFAGDTNYKSVQANGNLVVAQAGTTLGTVSGTASGGLATLTATLTSTVTNQGAAGETVVFTLNGSPAGSAVTNASGVATLINVATDEPSGSYPDAVVASFTGDTNYTAAGDESGTLTVS